MHKFNVLTDRFGHDMYFMQRDGKGFGLTSDPKEGMIIEGRDQALQEAERLSFVSGMKTCIQKIKRF